MAKVSVEFDTKEKTMSISIDGIALEDVSDVQFYRSWDDEKEYRCGISTISMDEDNDMRTITRLVAHQEGDLAKASLPDFFIKSTRPKVHDDIQNCFQ